MNQPFDAELIERIVQEVIRRLVERGIDIRSAATSEDKELAVSDKVVTLATLDGHLAGVKRLVVGGRSIVTPAVRDELNDRSIELVRR
ncbi:MAG: hypothetical protein O3C40_26165 [Planctomycetota bacterium]|nr:hypothetical protein [Planctomycetota bacterium]